MLAKKKQEKPTLSEYRDYAKQLNASRAILISCARNSPVGAKAVDARIKAIHAIDKVRSLMEESMFKNHPGINGALDVFYPNKGRELDITNGLEMLHWNWAMPIAKQVVDEPDFWKAMEFLIDQRMADDNSPKEEADNA